MAAMMIEMVELPLGVVTRLQGEGTFREADTLQPFLMRLTAKRPAVVVFDLAELVLITSLVLGALVGFRRAAARFGGIVKIAAPQPLVLDAIRTARLDQLFEITDSVDAALGAVPQ
jgi:anti-anti-sigma factor